MPEASATMADFILRKNKGDVMGNLPLSFNTYNVVFVNITQSYGKLKNRRECGLPPVKGRENIYECTRKYWSLSKEHADRADYIAGCFDVGGKNFKIISVYQFADTKKWMKVRYCPELADDEEVQENSDYMERFAFKGMKPPSREIQELFVGHFVDFSFGRKPVRYSF